METWGISMPEVFPPLQICFEQGPEGVIEARRQTVFPYDIPNVRAVPSLTPRPTQPYTGDVHRGPLLPSRQAGSHVPRARPTPPAP